MAVTPTATNSPPSSTINIPLNDNRANNLTVPLSSTGTLSATYGAATGKKTHLIFDVTGYFLADDTGATFSPLAPVRVLDTRPGRGRSACPARSPTASRGRSTIAGTNGVPGERDRDHRQPDRHPAVGRRLPGDHQGPDRGPGHLDPQLPGQRQPGQRRVRPARRVGGAVDRVQGHRRRPHPRHPGRDRLLRAGHGRPALRAAQPGPDHGHPAGRRAVGSRPARSTPAPPGRSTWPATGACRSGPRRSPAT